MQDMKDESLQEVQLSSLLSQHEISCLAKEETSSLSLSNLALECIPRQIAKFAHITILDLSNNKLRTFLGKWIVVRLPMLVQLNLAQNQLTALEDILELSKATRLESLNISQNPIRLSHNRIYLLEAMFRAPSVHENLYGMRAILKVSDFRLHCKTPRNEGFPMLHILNGIKVDAYEIADVEAEMSRKIRQYSPPKKTRRPKSAIVGSRQLHDGQKSTVRFRTVQEKAKLKAKQSSIPQHQGIQKLRCDENGNVINVEFDTGPITDGFQDELSEQEWKLFQQKLLLGTVISSSEQLHSAGQSDKITTRKGSRPKISLHEEIPSLEAEHSDMASKKMIFGDTFSTLSSDQRSAVRTKSKLQYEPDLAESPFENNTYIDCIAQTQRSRVLASIASDKLYGTPIIQPDATTHPDNDTSCDITTADQHQTTLNHESVQDNMLKQSKSAFQLHEEYCRAGSHTLSKHGAVNVKLNFHSLILEEKRRTRVEIDKLLPKSQSMRLLSATDTREILDESLQRMHLQNGVDFAPKVITSKNEKRYIQALINSDREVFEEDAEQQRLRAHLNKLEEIKNMGKNLSVGKHKKKMAFSSSWQRRNIIASQLNQRQKHSASEIPPSNNPLETTKLHKNNVRGFPGITTLEEAKLDTLPHVNSREILTRCADIRRNAKRDLKQLEHGKHKFVEDEINWENTRNDRIAKLTKRIERESKDIVKKTNSFGGEIVYADCFK